jgi:hypothetical protein
MRFETPINVAELPVSETSYDLLAPGWYTASIREVSLKNTKAGTGQYMSLRFDITGEKAAGRVVFSNINLRNPNAQAESIGRQQLGELLRALGLATATDTDQLIGGNVQIKVAIREARDGYDAQNEVKGYKAINGSVPAPVAAKPAPVSTAKAPWEK